MNKIGKYTNLSILLVDDHDTIISGLSYELKEKFANITMNIAENTQAAVDVVLSNDFDIAIIDISFRNEGNADGIELCRKIRAIKPQIKLISYSAYVTKIGYLKQLQEIGVEAIVSKYDGNFAVKYAIDEVLLGNTPAHSREVYKALAKLEDIRNKSNIKFTVREKKLIKTIHQNKHFSYEQIAQELHVSINTIRTHMISIYYKTKVNKKSSLIDETKDLLEFL